MNRRRDRRPGLLLAQDRKDDNFLEAPAHDVIVEGWTNLYNLNWAADGKGW